MSTDRIVAALKAIAKRVPLERGEYVNLAWLDRVLAAQGEAVEAAIAATCNAYEPYAPDFDEVPTAAAVEALERASRSEGDGT